MSLKACAYRKKGMLLLRGIAHRQFIHGVCGANTRAYLVQVSDQRGTCLVERPAKGGLCLSEPLVLYYTPLVGRLTESIHPQLKHRRFCFVFTVNGWGLQSKHGNFFVQGSGSPAFRGACLFFVSI